jgi:hypothetical protein
MVKYYRLVDMPMNKMFSRCLLLVLGATLSLSVSTVTVAADLEIKPYIARYKLFRSGKEHGSAERELFTLNSLYRLRYESSIKWMIFSDERFETSEFKIENNQVMPLNYKMERKGTGPDRSYSVTFDRENKKIIGPKKRKKRRKNQLPGATKWDESWLDPISYQQQLYIDLRLGKKEFNYAFINRKGVENEYKFRAVGEELLMLPYGSVKAIKIERVYDQESDRQTVAWFAPELDYALVRIWKGKSGVEQFDLQLNELVR